MRSYFVIIFIALCGSCLAQDFTRLPNEPIDSFVKRYTPAGMSLADTVTGMPFDKEIIPGKWNSTPTIVVFYGQLYKSAEDGPDENHLRLLCYVYLEKNTDQYQRVFIDTTDEAGAPPQIETAFFARASKKPDEYLMIITSWAQRHAVVSGILYETSVYSKTTENGKLVIYKEDTLSNQFDGGCDCTWPEDSTERTAPYKTEKDIRMELKRLGY